MFSVALKHILMSAWLITQIGPNHHVANICYRDIPKAYTYELGINVGNLNPDGAPLPYEIQVGENKLDIYVGWCTKS